MPAVKAQPFSRSCDSSSVSDFSFASLASPTNSVSMEKRPMNTIAISTIVTLGFLIFFSVNAVGQFQKYVTMNSGRLSRSRRQDSSGRVASKNYSKWPTLSQRTTLTKRRPAKRPKYALRKATISPSALTSGMPLEVPSKKQRELQQPSSSSGSTCILEVNDLNFFCFFTFFFEKRPFVMSQR
jgi:hypothetical protein